ncbi:MAG: hypothetical protein A3I05_08145 [Deltaproteobacteria bacterium RIFCSPLOWO2_02_FULL_44_10]|nr:MAG: hypothetical protein A3C46_05030 [Deltaproteobacteria bacterium RIFCSPHIGHO2_02_FULL_44_16]OGQ45930.1 MAG: hypothetical protein A3I05_08145 [Deltaproteobacteria bacterium RIFCSPLOWO2_02_FULL_44_10]
MEFNKEERRGSSLFGERGSQKNDTHQFFDLKGQLHAPPHIDFWRLPKKRFRSQSVVSPTTM